MARIIPLYRIIIQVDLCPGYTGKERKAYQYLPVCICAGLVELMVVGLIIVSMSERSMILPVVQKSEGAN